jgi:hypothetical protein
MEEKEREESHLERLKKKKTVGRESEEVVIAGRPICR